MILANETNATNPYITTTTPAPPNAQVLSAPEGGIIFGGRKFTFPSAEVEESAQASLPQGPVKIHSDTSNPTCNICADGTVPNNERTLCLPLVHLKEGWASLAGGWMDESQFGRRSLIEGSDVAITDSEDDVDADSLFSGTFISSVFRPFRSLQSDIKAYVAPSPSQLAAQKAASNSGSGSGAKSFSAPSEL
jgi:hypothetical protein